MQSDFPLCEDFIQRFPVEAARVLETLPPRDIATLFNSNLKADIQPLLVAMLPEQVACTMAELELAMAAGLLSGMPPAHAARVFRLLPVAKQGALTDSLTQSFRRRMERFLHYSAVTAGDLMEANVLMLPESLSVGEALKRIEKWEVVVQGELFIVDEQHRMVGALEFGQLFAADHHAKLNKVMQRKVPILSAHASIESLLSHPGWRNRRRLAVVERDNTLVGGLEYAHLQDVAGEVAAVEQGAMPGLFSLLGLYWMSLIQLLDSLFSLSGNRGGRQ